MTLKTTSGLSVGDFVIRVTSGKGVKEGHSYQIKEISTFNQTEIRLHGGTGWYSIRNFKLENGKVHIPFAPFHKLNTEQKIYLISCYVKGIKIEYSLDKTSAENGIWDTKKHTDSVIFNSFEYYRVYDSVKEMKRKEILDQIEELKKQLGKI